MGRGHTQPNITTPTSISTHKRRVSRTVVINGLVSILAQKHSNDDATQGAHLLGWVRRFRFEARRSHINAVSRTNFGTQLGTNQ